MTTHFQIHRQGNRPVLTVPLVLSALLCAALTGCLSRPPLVRQTFALQSPAATNAAATASRGVLAIASCEVSPLFASRSFVYRTVGDTYEVDPYAAFLVPPERAIAIPVRDGLRNSGAFKDVAEPGSLLRPDQLLQIHVTELYGDFRQPGQAAAVLTMRMLFFDAAGGVAERVSLERNYSRRVPLKENTAAAVVTGWNQALFEIMGDVAADLRGTQTRAPGP